MLNILKDNHDYNIITLTYTKHINLIYFSICNILFNMSTSLMLLHKLYINEIENVAHVI